MNKYVIIGLLVICLVGGIFIGNDLHTCNTELVSYEDIIKESTLFETNQYFVEGLHFEGEIGCL